MDLKLTAVEARILGSLMEKSLSTPEYYPLSLNALLNACNQKSSRDPVVDYDETLVQEAVEALCRKGVAFMSRLSRVPKYEEHFSKACQLVPKEIALLCVLLLRGPQTVGELRSRTARLYTFETLEDVTAAMENLIEYGLAHQLPRLPGRKEQRYAQLLSKESEKGDEIEGPENVIIPKEERNLIDRLERMEQAVDTLRAELDDLKQVFAEFKEAFR